ncbi:MAG: S49 family peptidase, partial [Kiritimatiellia bacterium]|nr:S49 family peptidase [Kiritimatiellia bacterium]
MNPTPPPLPVPTRRCSHGFFWAAIVLLSLALIGSLARSVKPGSRVKQRSVSVPEDQYPSFTETHSYGRGDVKAVRIPVQGVIVRSTETGWFGIQTDMTESILQQIRSARNDKDVKAILLEVDSPGGAITPTDEIAAALRDFRASRSDRRIVAYIRDLAASGGYYVIAGADRIVSEPTALVGSISVILQTLNWHGLSERIGITDTTIKSGSNKDLLNPFHPVPEEQRAMLQ